MTETLTTAPDRPPVAPSRPAPVDGARRVDWRRMKSPIAAAALVCAAIAAISTTFGTVVIGRLAEHPTSGLVWLLAACVIGASIIDTFGKIVWVGLSDRAEGRLREDLLSAAMRQPLATLSEQAVGEILDRVDDDTHEVGNLVRWQLWMFARTVFGVVPMWIVAGVTWWPSWLLFPALGVVTWFAIKPLLGEISRRKVIEEMAWTDHAAALEEGIAGRDDLRTSLGQAHVIARVAKLSSAVHTKFRAVLDIERRLALRAGLLLHALLAGIGVAGIALAGNGDLSVAKLVTLFLVTSTFVGQIAMLANHLPDLQAGLGAVIRLRQMLASEPEPEGGRPLPSADRLELEIRGLTFAYDEGTFALRDINLFLPAGDTIALVGRTGSGKSTLASLISRAVEPPRGAVLLGGVDVLDLDLQQLRSAVGVVTQRTEILAGTLAENITLFGDTSRDEIERAVAELGLDDWVAGLPAGLDTLLGPGGTSLSAGEEQLVAFARLLIRNVRVVVLDEATARMDPLTEHRVVAAADRLLRGRTGVLIAHRLSTIERAPHVAVLDHGRVVQDGLRATLALEPGAFRDLLHDSRIQHLVDHEDDDAPAPVEHSTLDHAAQSAAEAAAVGGRRRTGTPPPVREVGNGPSLAKGIFHALLVRPSWGIAGAVLFLMVSVIGAQGAVTGLVWGHIVEDLQDGDTPGLLSVALVACLLAMPFMLADAFWRYPRWWIEVMLRTRMSVLHGQTAQERLVRTPPGEVVARSMDADRYARYADRWVDFINGMLIAAFTALLAGTWVAGAVLLAVMVTSALASSIGRPIAGRSAAEASAARARFGRALVSALESARTVKLAAATPSVHRHLRDVDAGRVNAAVKEHRVQAFLDGVPIVMVQCGVVTAWAIYFGGGWSLATALLVANAVAGFDWFGRVAGMVVTEAPGTRAWQVETSRFAGGVDLMDLPPGVDLVSGAAPEPAPSSRVPLQQLELRGFSALHDDGTLGVSGVDLTVEAGELVLLVGQVGSGKSSLLAALAGLIGHRGEILWNDRDVDDPERFLRPGQVSHVAQVPRVLSGTFDENVRLGHQRAFDAPVGVARLGSDIEEAGGKDALVGHRGVRLSGGQVQRLALARALATDAELMLADDVSSALDASTEVELWQALRDRGATVIGATAKRAALSRADRVVVLVDGEVAAVGPWSELAPRWGHLAG
ncbi:MULTISPECIES: ATP-binding cassette domain-containing protein [unclassified Nocardioides]|uniref:ATP-binding cassette domain-containing protein n=1 Tax=unclassified Nocardioides TaxID=2615069 RepID=UPI0006F67325|nr:MULTISPECIES: ABC transporter ATP-binding protein [unclassified Nocardioides]KQY64701.1 ABC transporter [Nocardioides sp. Root140]KRF12604.1 ABC transporter [Nocardioides sp. Soil796]